MFKVLLQSLSTSLLVVVVVALSGRTTTRTTTQALQLEPPSSPSRRSFLLRPASVIAVSSISSISLSSSAWAAPPIAIIAEELGYFPVTNQKGETQYIPKRIKRSSSQQAVALAQYLSPSNPSTKKKSSRKQLTMYGAYWCPHCARQKELFGKEAWQYIDYVECAPKGYGYDQNRKIPKEVDGYPTFFLQGGPTAPPNRPVYLLSGEVPLSVLAEKTSYPGVFREELEENLPPPLGSAKCT